MDAIPDGTKRDPLKRSGSSATKRPRAEPSGQTVSMKAKERCRQPLKSAMSVPSLRDPSFREAATISTADNRLNYFDGRNRKPITDVDRTRAVAVTQDLMKGGIGSYGELSASHAERRGVLPLKPGMIKKLVRVAVSYGVNEELHARRFRAETTRPLGTKMSIDSSFAPGRR